MGVAAHSSVVRAAAGDVDGTKSSTGIGVVVGRDHRCTACAIAHTFAAAADRVGALCRARGEIVITTPCECAPNDERGTAGASDGGGVEGGRGSGGGGGVVREGRRVCVARVPNEGWATVPSASVATVLVAKDESWEEI